MPSVASQPESPCENHRLARWAWDPPWSRARKAPEPPTVACSDRRPYNRRLAMATTIPPQGKPPQKPTYAAAHFALELDGKGEIGMFRSIEGGGIKAEVLTYQHGNGFE